jgi:GT2 family glycosyltransferase
METFIGSNIAGVGGRCVEQFQETAADRWRALHLVQDLGGKNIVISPSLNEGLSGFAAVFRRSALEHVGGYNELYRTNWEDWDISVRLREAGYTLIYHTPAVAFHMRRDTSFSVVRTAWRWVFWIRYHDGSYSNLWLKLLQNLRRTWKKAWQHLRTGETSLLHVDCLYLICFCWWDLRYFLSQRTSDRLC